MNLNKISWVGIRLLSVFIIIFVITNLVKYFAYSTNEFPAWTTRASVFIGILGIILFLIGEVIDRYNMNRLIELAPKLDQEEFKRLHDKTWDELSFYKDKRTRLEKEIQDINKVISCLEQQLQSEIEERRTKKRN